MKAIKEQFGEIGNTSLVVTAEMYEFWSMEAIEGTSVIKVKEDGVIIKALGKKYRAFKPKAPFEVVVSIFNSLFLLHKISLYCRRGPSAKLPTGQKGQ